MSSCFEPNDELIAKHTRERRVNGSARNDDDASVNPDLSLLGTGRRPAPPFPLSILGGFCRDWVKRPSEDGVCSSRLCSGNLAGCKRCASGERPTASGRCGLVRTAALVGGQCRLAVLIQVPCHGCRLSSPSTHQKPASLQLQQEQTIYEMQLATAEAQREAWKAEVKAAIGMVVEPPLRPESAVLPDEPARPRVRVCDATVEKLGALSRPSARVASPARQLAGWLGAFDKYGGGGSDRAFAIEMYGGRPYTVDRMKNREPLHPAPVHRGHRRNPAGQAGGVSTADDGLPAPASCGSGPTPCPGSGSPASSPTTGQRRTPLIAWLR